MKELKHLVRPNIWALTPYSSARDEYKGHEAKVFLDANESPYNTPYNRYPDPLQRDLKKEIARIKHVPENCIFLGNGSDEAIDLPFRIFCTPQVDNAVSITPTYGMYSVAAAINDVEFRTLKLNEDFGFKATDLLKLTNQRTKLIYLCTPNNPTGNCLPRKEIEYVLQNFDGIVIVDEAYGDFSNQTPFREELGKYPNMIVLNTFSKAWGSAAIRLGMAFASPQIIELFNKVKYPYNVNKLTQDMATSIIKNETNINKWLRMILEEKYRLEVSLKALKFCQKIYPSDANFLLTKVDDAQAIYDYLVNKGIIVRNRNNVTLCEGCLRITVGSPAENIELLAALRTYK